MKIVPIRDSSEEQKNFNRLQTYLNKYKTHIINFLSFLLFIISYHLYIKSLVGCYESIYVCVQKISFFFYIGYLVFFSAALMSIILEMAFFLRSGILYYIFYLL
jgi:hypothetical protein